MDATHGSTSSAQIDAAEVYERLFVPGEFAEWTTRLLDAARVGAGQRVLDVACGTGVLAREAVRRVGAAGYVAGVDADAAMLLVAADRAPAIDWRRASAAALPFVDAAFDVVVSQFGLMYFDDRLLALREMQRVLRPGGALVVAVWDALERTPAYAHLVALFARAGHPRVADALRRPFALGDPGALAALFAAAGMPDATVTTHVGAGHFADVRTMVSAELEGWLPVVGITLAAAERERLITAAADVLRPHTDDAGRVRFAAPAHLVSVTRR